MQGYAMWACRVVPAECHALQVCYASLLRHAVIAETEPHLLPGVERVLLVRAAHAPVV